jgi:hypothetical protein
MIRSLLSSALAGCFTVLVGCTTPRSAGSAGGGPFTSGSLFESSAGSDAIYTTLSPVDAAARAAQAISSKFSLRTNQGGLFEPNDVTGDFFSASQTFIVSGNRVIQIESEWLGEHETLVRVRTGLTPSQREAVMAEVRRALADSTTKPSPDGH